MPLCALCRRNRHTSQGCHRQRQQLRAHSLATVRLCAARCGTCASSPTQRLSTGRVIAAGQKTRLQPPDPSSELSEFERTTRAVYYRCVFDACIWRTVCRRVLGMTAKLPQQRCQSVCHATRLPYARTSVTFIHVRHIHTRLSHAYTSVAFIHVCRIHTRHLHVSQAC